MAGIDKTYTNSYKDYKEFKDWADKQTMTFYDGLTECIGDWVWDLEEEDFSNREIPIMNTPTWVDIYLIQNCKIEFVLNRLKFVYGEKSYVEYQNSDLTGKPPANYKQNRKIAIRRYEIDKYPKRPRYYSKKVYWALHCQNLKFGFNEDTNKWTHNDIVYPHTSNMADFKSIRSVVRHLKRQFLPKGLSFTLSGKFMSQIYTITIL